MKTRLAVVGSGFGLYGLLPTFQQIPSCSIVGICGKSSPRLVDYCQKTNVPVFGDWKEMIDKCRPEAVAVAVVPKHQHEIISYALQRGLAVFAEKPLSVEFAQAAELLEMARAQKVAHMVDFLFPEIPEWRRTRELLAGGAIGKVAHVAVDWRFQSYDIRNKILSWKSSPPEGGGALSFYFSHLFYNLEYFLGKIQTLECRLTYSPEGLGDGETGVRLTAQFANGSMGNVIFDCASSEGDCHAWEFRGESGSLVLSKPTPGFTRGFQITRHTPTGARESIPVPPLEFDPTLDERVPLVKALGQRFIDWRNGLAAAQPDFSAGVRVQQLIDRARQSFQSKQPVSV